MKQGRCDEQGKQGIDKDAAAVGCSRKGYPEDFPGQTMSMPWHNYQLLGSVLCSPTIVHLE